MAIEGAELAVLLLGALEGAPDGEPVPKLSPDGATESVGTVDKDGVTDGSEPSDKTVGIDDGTKLGTASEDPPDGALDIEGNDEGGDEGTTLGSSV